jgi:hypothetical protein
VKRAIWATRNYGLKSTIIKILEISEKYVTLLDHQEDKMKKTIITMSVVLGLALGGILSTVSFTDITKNAVACGGKDKGATDDTDNTSGSGAQT